LVLYYFNVVTLQAEHVLKELQALFNALNGIAQMLNVRNLHIFLMLEYYK
jgi:hypothetical protein